MLDRDPHGNVQVAKIETERLLILLLEKKLASENAKVKFSAQSHYFGYEGRSCLPSAFDSEYCYGIGQVAGSLVINKLTGCMAVLRQLDKEVKDWVPAGVPLVTMMTVERRKGEDKPVIEKMLVKMDSPCFKVFKAMREHWQLHDCYRAPGPIQFEKGKDRVNYLVKPPLMQDMSFDIPTAKDCYSPKVESNFSLLQKDRMITPVELPQLLQNGLD